MFSKIFLLLIFIYLFYIVYILKQMLRAKKKAVNFDHLVFTTAGIKSTNKGSQKWKVNYYVEANIFIFYLSIPYI